MFTFNLRHKHNDFMRNFNVHVYIAKIFTTLDNMAISSEMCLSKNFFFFNWHKQYCFNLEASIIFVFITLSFLNLETCRYLLFCM